MPYISSWLGLPQALKIIQDAEKCDRDSAWSQLRDAIADEKVQVKWVRPPEFLIPSHFRKAGLNKQGTKVLDTQGIYHAPDKRANLRAKGELKYRSFLVLRDSVEKLWTRQAAREATSARLPGPRSARTRIEQELNQMKTEGEQVCGNQQKLAEQVAKRVQVELGSRNWAERTVISHISNWQKQNCESHAK